MYRHIPFYVADNSVLVQNNWNNVLKSERYGYSAFGLNVERRRVENYRALDLISYLKKFTLGPINIRRFVGDFVIFSKNSFTLKSFSSPKALFLS